MQAFESELKKYMAVEQEISQVAPMHNIGSLALETQPLKYSLKSEAASWKAQYAKNLHKQGSEDLKAFDQYMRDTTLKLNRKVEDLEDVRFIMGVLKEVSTVTAVLTCALELTSCSIYVTREWQPSMRRAAIRLQAEGSPAVVAVAWMACVLLTELAKCQSCGQAVNTNYTGECARDCFAWRTWLLQGILTCTVGADS